jgi:hypothetical protein
MHCCDRLPVATLVSLALLVSGCSSGSMFGGPAPAAPNTAAAPAQPSTPSATERLTSFFSSSSSGPSAVKGTNLDLECPYIDIRQGASTLAIGGSGDKAAMSLRYQGTFIRAARECAVAGTDMVMKIGVEGRIILGPAGGPGVVDVPLRIAVVREYTVGSKTITTKLIHIPVTVASASENPTFTHVEEGVAFPLPQPVSDLAAYTVYIGFDPIAAEAQAKPAAKPKAKAKPKSKSEPTASND